MIEQLLLPIKLNQQTTFANFVAGPNGQLVACLQSLFLKDETQFIYLWGEPGSGKSHLLQAVCHHAYEQQQLSFYLSLAEEKKLQPSVLHNLADYPVVCIDDVDKIMGQQSWEEALFHCYNQLRSRRHCLVLSAKIAANGLPCQLADLQSRLNWGLTFHLQSLGDSQKAEVLRIHAKAKGMALSNDVLNYIIHRYSRDMPGLLAVLAAIEKQSLIAKRRITIPFLRTLQL